jgi:hypothetical protein
MMMRFRGGGVGHSSTRAATDTFKNDRDELDIISQQARKGLQVEPQPGTPTHPNVPVEEVELEGDDDNEMNEEISNSDAGGEREILVEGEVDEEGLLSESEMVDYGYELDSDSESDEEDDDDREPEAGEEDD